MYHSDDEEDYGAARLRLAFNKKKEVQKHIEAEEDLMKNLLAIREHTQKILKTKAMSALGVRVGKLFGNKKKEVIKQNAPTILKNFVNEEVLKTLSELFMCDKKLEISKAHTTLMEMMLARYQVEVLSEDDKVPAGTPKPTRQDFEDAVENYFALHVVQETNARQQNTQKKDLSDLANFISAHKSFMDVIVMHLAANHHMPDKGSKKEGPSKDIRMVEKGYFATVFDEVKKIVKKQTLEKEDLFYLFMFNRIVYMCEAFNELAKANDVSLPEKTMYICQSVMSKNNVALLTSINDGKNTFSTKINLFLNVIEHFMIEYYVTEKAAIYNCKNVSITKSESGNKWTLGSPPKNTKTKEDEYSA